MIGEAVYPSVYPLILFPLDLNTTAPTPAPVAAMLLLLIISYSVYSLVKLCLFFSLVGPTYYVSVCIALAHAPFSSSHFEAESSERPLVGLVVGGPNVARFSPC
jgi:hypothetical protein